MSSPDGRHMLHMGIAEAGKLHALEHRHGEALRHYREALRLAVAAKAPEVFFRHYTQCTLESLELMDSHDDVIRYCEKADAHHERLGHTLAVHRRDHAEILQRLGIAQLKAGKVELAKASLRRAVTLAGPGALPVAEEVSGWLSRRLSVDAGRILQSQRRHRYFTVRHDQVDRTRARPLPGGDAWQRTPTELIERGQARHGRI